MGSFFDLNIYSFFEKGPVKMSHYRPIMFHIHLEHIFTATKIKNGFFVFFKRVQLFSHHLILVRKPLFHCKRTLWKIVLLTLVAVFLDTLFRLNVPIVKKNHNYLVKLVLGDL